MSVQIFTFNPVQENCYVVYNQNSEAIIIDPGCYGTAEETTLINFINVNNLKPLQLINTHCHFDHVFGNKLVAATYGLQLYLHANEKQMLAFAPQSVKMFGLELDNYEGPLNTLDAGDTVSVGSEKLTVLLTPGHSPGSICLYSKSNGFVVAGDVLFRESIGRTDLPGGNHQALLDSISQELFSLPDETVVYPGHGPSTTIGYEKQHNPFFNQR